MPSKLAARKIRVFAIAAIGMTGLAGNSMAADMDMASDWGFDAGIRYWYSSGKADKDLYNGTGTLMLSRLTYSKLTAHSGEGFLRLDHNPSNIFVKGLFGLGGVTGGKLQDEDFPPVTVPYSSTLSKQDNGNLSYATIDLGYNLMDRRSGDGLNMRLGIFAGYNYYHQYLNAYGCRQTATSTICVPTIPNSVKGISQDNDWHSLRIGAVMDLYPTDNLKLTFDAAYIHSWLRGKDHHWLRPAINPLPERGHGDGFQIEGVMSYKVTDNFSLGIGGRYWYFGRTKGHAHFEEAPVPGIPQVEKWRSRRYGVFIQAGYEF